MFFLFKFDSTFSAATHVCMYVCEGEKEGESVYNIYTFRTCPVSSECLVDQQEQDGACASTPPTANLAFVYAWHQRSARHAEFRKVVYICEHMHVNSKHKQTLNPKKKKEIQKTKKIQPNTDMMTDLNTGRKESARKNKFEKKGKRKLTRVLHFRNFDVDERVTDCVKT